MKPDSSSIRRGRIELVCGPMFSGKSERLLDCLREAQARRVATAAFKHALDTRYDARQIVTHSGRRTAAHAVAAAACIIQRMGEARLIVVDEAQFFGMDLVSVCRRLADEGRTIVVAGLDRDSWGEPFGPMPCVAEIADEVVSLRGVCAVCGGAADRTQRVAPIVGTLMIGGRESYQPRCLRCFVPPPLELRR